VPALTLSLPPSPIEPVTEVLHGVPVVDPYRWLEDQNAPRTQKWIDAQTRYARAHLDSIPGRERIRERIREFLAIETYDSLQRVGSRYFFRRRLPDQEQPCIYMREGADGQDQLLVDPIERGTGKYAAVKPVHVSSDGRLLLYEIKAGGERTGTFELFDVESCRTLPDVLPRGYLRGFAFAPGAKSFYYVHERLESRRPFYRAVYRHVIGSDFGEDEEIFYAGEDEKLRLCIVADETRLGFLVYRFLEKTQTSFYLKPFEGGSRPECIVVDADYTFALRLVHNRILGITDRDAPNLRIAELRLRQKRNPEWVDLVPEADSRIHQWDVVGNRIFASYIRQGATHVSILDLAGNKTGEMPIRSGETVRFVGSSTEGDELFIETESFTQPTILLRYSLQTGTFSPWAQKKMPFDSASYSYTQIWYTSKDGVRIPMFLMGRRDVLAGGQHPTIMTSYGGFGLSMTPQFSVFVAFLVERGCLFALPNIRGGSEFGSEWHEAGKRRKRQTAYDDFLTAAEWLTSSGRTTQNKLAIFGGSNSGLLVAAALTQRPDLFRVVLCMVPMLDMLRYHLFDGALVWRDEFGTAADPDDFAALARYSPYHRVRDGVSYPATLIVSGDADQNCNPLHSRKMTARLQAANSSDRPILLDYSPHRGHSPVLPLSERIKALTDRIGFLCDQLQLSV
jgi:prolyl oligopeptidase